MKPLGYMAKRVAGRPEWLHTRQVTWVYSVSSCTSEDFTDWITCWRHNGYWLFDSLTVIDEIVQARKIDATALHYFYYEADPLEYDEDEGWCDYQPDREFPLAIEPPVSKRLMGYDVVTFTCGYTGCSPLSCNHVAEKVAVNVYCLLDTPEAAKDLITSGLLKGGEPGPWRVVAVWQIDR